MPALGINGSGNTGAAIARLAVAGGIPVVMANCRGPQTLTDVIAELGPLATARAVSFPRGAIIRGVWDNVRTGHGGSAHRQIRLRHSTMVPAANQGA